MEQLWQDLKYAARIFIEKPALVFAAVFILAVGVGATTAIFSVVNGVLLRPLPYPNSDRLVKLWESFVTGGTGTVSAPNLADWRSQNNSFETISAYETGSMSLQGEDTPVRLSAAYVSPDFFRALGVEARLGRFIADGEDQPGKNHVAVLSDRLWRNSFGADPAIVGKEIRLDGEPYTAIAVAPASLRYPSSETDLWTPLIITPKQMQQRGNHYLFALGLLKRGVSMAEAQAEMSAIASRIEQAYPVEQAGRNVRLFELKEETVSWVRPALLIILGAVVFVLLMVCANIANLQLARASGRGREMAIRAALGASPSRLIRQCLTESLVLAGLGGALGILVAEWSLSFLLALAGSSVPRSSEVNLDLTVLAAAACISMLSGFAFGLVPALYSARINTHDALKEGGRLSAGRTQGRIYTFLVAGETALAVVLLIGSGVMIKSFIALQHRETGLDPQNVLTLRVTLPAARYADRSSRTAFYKQALERISALPGVGSAAFISFIPMQRWGWNSGFKIEGREPFPPGREPFAERRAVTPDYFQAMGIPLMEGRSFTEQDNKDGLQVAIINQALARYFPEGKDQVGGRIQIGDTWCTVVGVVKDVRNRSLYHETRPESYRPYSQEQDQGLIQSMSLVAKANIEPTSLTDAIRRQIAAIDPGEPIYNVKTMSAVISDSISDSRLNSTLLGIFAGIALLLAVVGIYGVVSYWVNQRGKEIGVRVALGARSVDILKMVVRRGMLPVLLGFVVGVPSALWLTMLLSRVVYLASTMDTLLIVGITGLLGAAALAACLVPAARATRLDPINALREE